MSSYVSLHNHSDYSLLDGLGKIPDYVARAAKLKQPALGLSDHGVIAGSWEFYTACKKAGINPVIGLEGYFTPSVEAARELKDRERFHITLFAKNEDGFKTLTQVVTASNRQFYGKPMLDRPLLESLKSEADNLVCFSGCAASIVSRKLMSKDKDERKSARDEVEWWRSIFSDYYVELMSHGFPMEGKLNGRLIKLARSLHIPLVVTNDPHYVHKEEAKHHDALLAIQTASDIDDPTRFRFDGKGYHLRSDKEIARAFRGYPRDVVAEGLASTLEVAEKCQITIPAWDNKTWHIPRYPKLPDKYNGDSYAFLEHLAHKALRQRGLNNNEQYVARTDRELAALKAANMADFLLITREAIRWAVKRDIRVGPGRGSIAGCFVAYLLGIHKIDSVRYNLLFERFLNPERPKPPDVDSDFEPDRRQEVIDHYTKVYGSENVVRVAAYQTMKVAGVFQTLAKAHGVSPQDRNRLTKELGQFQTGDDDERDEEEDISVLPEELRETYPDMAAQMRALLGTKRAISRHAAGIVIFDPKDPIKDLVGLQWLINKSAPGGGNWAAQFDLKSVEGMSLMKQDNLGLRTLATIKECCAMVKANHGVELDPDSWVPDEEEHDEKIYQMLTEGRTSGVFQAEGPSNTQGLQEVQPTDFQDIAVVTALYRKGPRDAGSDKRFLRNKRDNKIRVIHKSLKPLLQDTRGEMVYDDQMLEILHTCAGLSWGRVDDAKNAMKKKDPAMMDEIRSDAVAGFIKTSGMTKKQARKTWEMIAAQSAYLFNKEHAIAYSLTTYQTARLKYLYPLEFLTALVRTVKPSSPAAKLRRMGYVAELSDLGYKILGPDVNASQEKASCGYENGKGWFRFGLVDCSGIGDNKARKFIQARQTEPIGFFGVEDVQEATDKGTFKVLAQVGAMESVGGPASSNRLKQEITGYRFNDPMRKIRKKLEKKLILPKEDKDFVRLYGEITVAEKKETRNGKAYCTWTLQWSPTKTWRVQVWDTRNGINGIKRGSIVRVEGEWSEDWRNISVNDSEDIQVIKEPK